MNRTVLITGASSGLGRELARIFGQHGDDLIIVARRQERLMELKNELEAMNPVKVYPFAADLTDPSAPLQIAQFIQANHLHVDILINNAGFGEVAEFVNTDFQNIEKMFRVNVLAAMHLVHLLLPDMLQRKSGHIVNIASIAAFFPGPLMAAYFSTKSTLYSFTKALEFELKESGVNSSLVCPGPFQTEFQSIAFPSGKGDNLPFAKEIAQDVARKILKKQNIIIPGFRYQLMYFLRNLVPTIFWGYGIYAFHKNILKTSSSTVK